MVETLNHNQDPHLEVELLKRDIAVFDKYFQKIDTTLEKLGDATTQMTRMIALHEERLEQSQADSSELKQLLEERRKETQTALHELEHKNDALGEKFSESEKRIAESILQLKKELVIEIGRNRDKADDRIKRLEFWRYMVIGGTMVIIFFASKFIQSYFDRFMELPQIHVTQPTSPVK